MGEIRKFIGEYPLHSLAFGLVAAFEISKITERVPGVGGLGTGIQPNREPSRARPVPPSSPRPNKPSQHIPFHRTPEHLRPPKRDPRSRQTQFIPVSPDAVAPGPPPKGRPQPGRPDTRWRGRDRPNRNFGGLGMTTSTSTTTSSSHIPGLMDSSAGETSMPLETNALFGVPNAVKRRVLYGGMPDTPADNLAKENALVSANTSKQHKEHSDIVGLYGVHAPVGGYGWI